MIRAAFVLFTAVTAQAAERPECTIAAVTRDCEVLREQGSTQYIYLPNGTYFRNPEYDSSFWSLIFYSDRAPAVHEVTPAHQARIEGLVRQARETILNGILRGRPLEALSAGEKNQYERVRTVRFDMQESLNDESISCLPAEPNAHYSPSRHAFTLCRSSMMLPDAALIRTIGHEIAHAIDPCVMSLNLYRVHQRPASEPFFHAEDEYQAVRSDYFEPQDADLSAALAAGEVEIAGPICKPEDYPQREEAQCLIRNGLGNGPIPDDKVLTSALAISRDLRGPRFDQTLGDIVEGIRRRPECFNERGLGNPVQESLADMWGTRVLAEYWKKNPPRSDLERFSGFAMFARRICGPHRQTELGDDFDGTHLLTSDRVDKIFLTNPDIQGILGCAPKHETCDTRAYAPAGGEVSAAAAPNAAR